MSGDMALCVFVMQCVFDYWEKEKWRKSSQNVCILPFNFRAGCIYGGLVVSNKIKILFHILEGKTIVQVSSRSCTGNQKYVMVLAHMTY